MGYLDNSTITVDAILTKHGRWKLSDGQSLGISKFALSDDGVDYNLWNIDHASGSDSYGEAIKNLPQLEAVPDDSMLLRYKLMTLDRGTVYMPILKLTPSSADSLTISLQGAAGAIEINPTTQNGPPEQYEFTMHNSAPFQLTQHAQPMGGNSGKSLPNRADAQQQVKIVGKTLKLQAKPTDQKIVTGVTVTGKTSGVTGFTTITILENIKKFTSR